MKSSLLKLAIVASLMSLSVIASAQVYVGGSIAASYNKSGSDSKTWSFNLNPEVGYFLNDNWAIGGRIAFGRAQTSTLGTVKGTSTTFTINPYAAYSPFQYGDFALWAEFGLRFAPKVGGASYASYGAYAVPVLTYNLGDHFVLKTNLNFAALSVSGTSDGGFAFAGSANCNRGLSVGDLTIGFVYKF